MNRVEIICPTCRAAYNIHRVYLGKYARCKRCGQSFLAAEADLEGEQPLHLLESLSSDIETSRFIDLGPAFPPTPPPVPLPPPPPPARAAMHPVVPYVGMDRIRIKSRTAMNIDWLAPVILLGYILMLFLMGIHFTVAAIPFFITPTTRIESSGYVWLRLFLSLLSFFVIVAPAAWGAIVLAARIGREDAGYSSFLRSASIAAIPMLFILFVGLITPTPSAVIIMLAVILPTVFVCLKLIFDFDLPWTVLAFVFGLLFVTPAYLVSGGVQKWTIGAIRGEIPPAAQVAGNTSQGGNSTGNATGAGPAPVSPVSRAESLRHRLESFDAEDFSTKSREALESKLAIFKLDADSIRAESSIDPNWKPVENLLERLAGKVAQATSAKPDAAIFEPLVASNDWSTAPPPSVVAPPVSFKTYLIQAPFEAKFDLASSEDSLTGFTWSLLRGGRVSFKTIPLASPKQHRPWVIDKPFMRQEATRAGLLTIDGEGATVETGLINGIPFTRVARETSASQALSQTVQYVARDADVWIIIEIDARAENARALNLFESAVRAFRRAPADAPRVDAFSPDRIAPRLADDETGASRILRAHGKAAEDAVLKQLENGGVWVKRAAALLLTDIGTEKSISALTDAAKSNDSSLADAAKAALHKLSPATMDPVALAMIDLDATSSFKRADALKALAGATADDRRAEIAPKLESLLLDDKAFPSEYDDVAAAVAVWSRKETVSNLIPLLDDEHGSMFKRQAAMKALGRIGDAKAVYPISRWLIKDSMNAANALIAIGPGAEDEMIKLVRDKNAIARLHAARVLEKIGTGKCLPELHRAGNDPRDKPAADAAQLAEDTIRQRIKDQKK